MLCLLLNGCAEVTMSNSPDTLDNFESPPSSDLPADMMEEASVPYSGEEEQAVTDSNVLRVKQAYESQLLEINGVMGVGIQQNELGDEVIWVYLRDEAVRPHVPSELEGISVVTEVTGEFEAY
ncbi:hypothetical protein [Pleurocapsa sp. PCC 7319]|uniref:hypothetical protein n=1 Tax=Pleurocapsa sp. PCC 7319 TaxID=118161 RepID=UPI001181860D|nr:hypothetical protein [Pleurocapsa sp. PCC 7319]